MPSDIFKHLIPDNLCELFRINVILIASKQSGFDVQPGVAARLPGRRTDKKLNC